MRISQYSIVKFVNIGSSWADLDYSTLDGGRRKPVAEALDAAVHMASVAIKLPPFWLVHLMTPS